MEKVLILDFGGQYKQLIARRVRECNVYCEVHPYTMPLIIFALCPAHGCFIADAVGFLRRYLPGLKGLVYLIAQHIRLATLLPPGDCAIPGL